MTSMHPSPNATEKLLAGKDVIVILGVSANPERTAHQALHMAREHGLSIVGVHPKGEGIAGFEDVPVLADLRQATAYIDQSGGTAHTLSVYLRPTITETLIEEIVRLAPERIILNPGAEDTGLIETLRARGLTVVAACTLVLLRTGQY